jgi:hypothetical protein
LTRIRPGLARLARLARILASCRLNMGKSVPREPPKTPSEGLQIAPTHPGSAQKRLQRGSTAVFRGPPDRSDAPCQRPKETPMRRQRRRPGPSRSHQCTRLSVEASIPVPGVQEFKRNDLRQTQRHAVADRDAGFAGRPFLFVRSGSGCLFVSDLSDDPRRGAKPVAGRIRPASRVVQRSETKRRPLPDRTNRKGLPAKPASRGETGGGPDGARGTHGWSEPHVLREGGPCTVGDETPGHLDTVFRFPPV